MSEIQDFIKKFNETKNRQYYQDIIELIKSEEKIFIAFSPVTKNYYIDYVQGTPTVFIFSEEEYCRLFQDYLLQQNISINVLENPKEHRMFILGDFYRCGFENIVVDNGQTFLNMSLFDIISKPDFSKISDETEVPVLNPSLVCSANRFFQSLASKKCSRDMEYNMLVDIYNAKYLLPSDAKMIQPSTKNTYATLNKEDIISVPSITDTNGKKIIPFFTDWNEFSKYDTKKIFKGYITTFSDIEYFCQNGETVSINPFGFNMIIDEKSVNVIKSVAKNAKNNDGQEKVVIFDLDVYPKVMTEKLKEYFSSQSNIKSAYMRGIKAGENVGYLIIVDFDGNKNTVFGKIAEITDRYSEGLPTDFIEYSSETGKKAAQNTEPFYKSQY